MMLLKCPQAQPSHLCLIKDLQNNAAWGFLVLITLAKQARPHAASGSHCSGRKQLHSSPVLCACGGRPHRRETTFLNSYGLVTFLILAANC